MLDYCDGINSEDRSLGRRHEQPQQILQGVTEAATFDIVDGEHGVSPGLRDLNLREATGFLIL